ncbi:MAG: 4Fe-4S binding protein [Proteobacteria bacterium]|nr:4Fe-4S binding protein [Pseudomonadota bacterium]
MIAPPDRLQRRRRATQAAFFVLFALAPCFDLLRYDLTTGHAWLVTREWRLGIDPFLGGEMGAATAAAQVLLRLFVPLLGLAALVLLVAWRWGRVYCGWLCPHFSVVETINQLLERATGKQSLWDREAARWRADGRRAPRNRLWGVAVGLCAAGFAAAWAVVLLTYLLPPARVYGEIARLEFARPDALFLVAATTVLTAEFLLGRHLFCRYACAVGLFQSIAWMGNRRALVVGFERERGSACATCLPERAFACEQACPMRLQPRALKRRMFACTQCGQCIAACTTRQAPDGRSLLEWVAGEQARQREAGFGPSAAGPRR